MQSACVSLWGRYLRPVCTLMNVSATSVVASVHASPTWLVRTAIAVQLTRGTSTAGQAASAATATPSTQLDLPAIR